MGGQISPAFITLLFALAYQSLLLFLKECAEDEVSKVAKAQTASSIRSTLGNISKGAFHFGEVRIKIKLIKVQMCI